jgi:hypothetical protein
MVRRRRQAWPAPPILNSASSPIVLVPSRTPAGIAAIVLDIDGPARPASGRRWLARSLRSTGLIGIF